MEISMFPSIPFISQGWQCPACLTVHAPHISQCGCQHHFEVFEPVMACDTCGKKDDVYVGEDCLACWVDKQVGAAF